MSELQREATVLSQLTDADLSKILGLTVDIELIHNDEKLTGMIYSLLKQKNFLIRKIPVVFHFTILYSTNKN